MMPKLPGSAIERFGSPFLRDVSLSPSGCNKPGEDQRLERQPISDRNTGTGLNCRFFRKLVHHLLRRAIGEFNDLIYLMFGNDERWSKT